jgi:hypothetical protein
LELDVDPAIGNRPINDITAYEIVDTIKGIATRGALNIHLADLQQLRFT